MQMSSDWHRIDTGLTMDRHKIGPGLEDCHWIDGLPLDWMNGLGLVSELAHWSRVGIGLAD